MIQDTPTALPSELALIEKAVRHVGIKSLLNHGAGSLVYSEGVQGVTQEDLVAYTREIALHCVVTLGPQAATSAAGGATGDQQGENDEQQVRSEVDAVGGRQPMEGTGTLWDPGHAADVLGDCVRRPDEAHFRGDNRALVSSIVALLGLDKDGALVPHGIGGHGRALLAASAVRLAALAAQSPAVPLSPLSDEQIEKLLATPANLAWLVSSKTERITLLIRAVEKAHGITPHKDAPCK